MSNSNVTLSSSDPSSSTVVVRLVKLGAKGFSDEVTTRSSSFEVERVQKKVAFDPVLYG
jgi:hypothetical protein